MTIPLMRSTFLHERDTLTALSDWLASCPSPLSMGPLCAQFERAFAEWQGRKYAVLFNSGASANLALLQALLNMGVLEPGATIGFSALTWATNVMPIMQLGFVPVPVDVDPCTLNVTSETLAGHWAWLDALFVTNALGYLPDLDVIQRTMPGRTLLLEDNCESLGSALPSGKAGNFGMASTFSFFVAHHMSTIEGGMVCTNDAELDEMLRMVRANGWDRNLTPDQQARWRYQYGVTSEFDAKYTFYVPGFNLRPTEIAGFLGLQQLRYLEENLRIRAEHYHALESVALTNPDLMPLRRDHMSRLAPFAFPVVCQTPELRAQYVQRFQHAGVEVRPVIAGNITRQPFYQASFAHTTQAFPGADVLDTQGFYFGIYPDLTPGDLDTLKGCLNA